MTNEEPKVADAGRYTMTETCKVLGIQRNTLRRWLQAGKIKDKFRRIDNRKVFEGSEIKKVWSINQYAQDDREVHRHLLAYH